MKSYYSYSNVVTMFQMEDQIELISQLNEILKEYVSKLTTMTEYLIDESDTCLFNLVAAYALEVTKADGSSSELMDIMDSVIEKINKIETLFKTGLAEN